MFRETVKDMWEGMMRAEEEQEAKRMANEAERAREERAYQERARREEREFQLQMFQLLLQQRQLPAQQTPYNYH